jgi:hypothetical protein
MSKKYITEKALSAMTGRALQTLRNDRFNGKGFPYIKLGKSVRYDLEEAITLMEKSKIATSSFKNQEGV